MLSNKQIKRFKLLIMLVLISQAPTNSLSIINLASNTSATTSSQTQTAQN